MTWLCYLFAAYSVAATLAAVRYRYLWRQARAWIDWASRVAGEILGERGQR